MSKPIAAGLSYYHRLLKAVERLDRRAAPYLVNRPDKSLEELAEENYELGMAWFTRAGEDFDAVPESVALIADGHVPFGETPRNGSLNFLLGYSLAAMEAGAWHLNDFLLGKTKQEWLPFGCLATVPADRNKRSSTQKASRRAASKKK